MCPLPGPVLVRVEVTGIPQRCDLALLLALRKIEPSISRASLKSWFQQDLILLQGQRVLPSRILDLGTYLFEIGGEGDIRGLLAPIASPGEKNFILPILYEDDDLFVIHKKSGIPSVPHHSSEKETAVNFALAHLPELAGVGTKPLEPGLLHRLDTETSGILVFAKTQSEFERLRVEWKKEGVKKYYRALVKASKELTALPLPFRMNVPLAHSARSSKRMVAVESHRKVEIRGKPLPALTWILDVQKVGGHLLDLEIEIKTGVMHQIRCHLSSNGWPILGDSVYRGEASNRLWLHAWRLSLPLKSGEILKIEAPLPDGWQQR